MTRQDAASRHARLPGILYTPLAISGLVCAYRFLAGEAPKSLDPAEVPEALAQTEGWVWLHLNLMDRFARNWLAELSLLPEEARELFAASDEPLSLAGDEGVVHGVIADFQGELAEKTDTIGRLRFALGERFVITARRHPLQAIQDIRRDVHKGLALPLPGNLIEMVADRFCDSVVRINAQMTMELDQAEDHVVAEMVDRERARVVSVRRLALRLHRQLSALTGVFGDWAEEEGEDGPPALQFDAERLTARLDSLDHDILTVQDRAKLLQDEVAARLAEDTNRSLRALSIMTALLLPGSLVAGVFGMNTHGLPFLDTPGGFWFVMAIGGGATALFYWILRRVGAGLRF
jgi:zinc transporter